MATVLASVRTPGTRPPRNALFCAGHAWRSWMFSAPSSSSRCQSTRLAFREREVTHTVADPETALRPELPTPPTNVPPSINFTPRFVDPVSDLPTPTVNVFAPKPSSHKRVVGHPRNMDIGYSIVQLVDPETDRLRPPTALANILSSIDLKTHLIELVREHPTPIVKLVSKQAAFEGRKASRGKRKSQMELKEVQMTWGVASGDLAHKLRKVRQELEKGNRVDLVYAPRKGQPVPTFRQKEWRVQETLKFIQDVGKEWKPKEIHGAMTVIHLQGTQPAS